MISPYCHPLRDGIGFRPSPVVFSTSVLDTLP